MAETVLLKGQLSGGYAIPPACRGGWCIVSVPETGASRTVQLDVARQSGRPWTGRVLGTDQPGGRWSSRAVIFLPDDGEALRMRAVGGEPPAKVWLQRLPRLYALGLILWHRPSVLGRALRGLVHGQFAGWCQRLRADASVASVIAFHPRCYRRWTKRFDQWGHARKAVLMESPRRAGWPDIDAVVFADKPAGDAAKATRASLRDQWWPVRRVLDGSQADLATADYVAVLQAGEIVPPHAMALLADDAAIDEPPLLMADEDKLDRWGRRHDPFFKPRPNHALMLSGALSRGVWLIRRDLLSEVAATGGGAEALRLSLWLALWRREGNVGRNLPFVLTHRRHDAEEADPRTLATVVERHAAAADLTLRVTPSRPLKVRPELSPGREERVAIVIASRCRDPVSLSCIRAILDRTTGVHFEIVLVLAQPAVPDAEQKKFIAALGDTDRVRVLHVPMAQFNYAIANNAGVRATSARFVLLLNDDVAPGRADWLSAMVAHLRDKRVGVVGAKLLYPDRTVQHAGVIMGLDGVAEHAGRLLGRDSPGPAGLFTLDREVSAVTGACMLTRRRVFDALDGLDESFARAFNDVDYCLRARAAGWGVVLSAKSPLIHHESLSYGSHYEDAESSRSLADEQRMRARWSGWIENDPFHSPNLALFRIADTEPAFPPRVARPIEPSMQSDPVRAQHPDRSSERALQPAAARTGAVA